MTRGSGKKGHSKKLTIKDILAHFDIYLSTFVSPQVRKMSV